MPSRSSRSRPASRTSCSEPTGSASLAIAIAVFSPSSVVWTLTTGAVVPVVRLAERTQPGPCLLVAKGSRQTGLVERARLEPERRRGLVVAREVGLEQRRVVGRDRAAHAGGDELRERMLGQRAHDSEPQVRERADVEDGAAAGELADEAVVVSGPNAVADPVR